MKKLIVIEGSDGSGKSVQSNLLAKRLNASVIEFPQYYKTVFGKLIGQYLNGELKLNPYAASLLYAWDRLEAREQILDMLRKCNVVANRYIASNIAHQGARLSRKEQQKFIKWLENIEFKENKMPRPDLTFYLYVPIDVAQQLILKKDKREYLKEKKKDIHEKDIAYLKKVEAIYKKLSKSKDWVLVNCVKDGKIMTKKEIHELIWQKVKQWNKNA